jgi:hypothetical protein
MARPESRSSARCALRQVATTEEPYPRKAEPSNKELKLTKPGEIGASQLNSSVRPTRGGSRVRTDEAA